MAEASGSDKHWAKLPKKRYSDAVPLCIKKTEEITLYCEGQAAGRCGQRVQKTKSSLELRLVDRAAVRDLEVCLTNWNRR